jgi:hypothetical protein
LGKSFAPGSQRGCFNEKRRKKKLGQRPVLFAAFWGLQKN